MATRNQNLIGLAVISLKFGRAGFRFNNVITLWLRTLIHQDMAFFEISRNRSNLYYWSGAAAALFALIDHDSRAVVYQDKIWHAAIADIRSNGTLPREIVRGQRALIYHMYAFSALLMLRAAREPLGYNTTLGDDARLRLLARTIGQTLCDPQQMRKEANANLEVPGAWAYRIPLGLGTDLLDNNWKRCGNLSGDVVDIGFGGNTRATAATLRELEPARH